MLKELAKAVGIFIFMIGVSWVPDSDVPVEISQEINVPKMHSPFSKMVEPSGTIWKTEEIIDDIEIFDEADKEAVYVDEYEEQWEYIGAYDITAYEWTGYPCANGNYPTEGYTVACNNLPLGTLLYIDGIGYRTVEDRGADWHSDYWIDLYLGDVSACFEWGIRTRDVWIVY